MAKLKQDDSGTLFTRGDYELLRRERRRLNDLIPKLEKAQACGVACESFRSMRDEIDTQLAAIEQHFMTPPPK